MLGFETIGNATITVFDDVPVLQLIRGCMANPTLEVGPISIQYLKYKKRI